MQSVSPCLTSAGWSSGPASIVCEGLGCRESVSFRASFSCSYGAYPPSRLDEEDPEGRLSFPRKQHCHAAPLVLSISVLRKKGKVACRVAGLSAPVDISVDYETDEALFVDDFEDLSSAYSTPSSVLRSSQVVGEESTDNYRNAEGEKVAVGPTLEWRHETWCEEETRSVVIQYLESRGLCTTLSLIAVQQAPTFIYHLISILQSCYPARYASGKELTRSEIGCVVLPYLAHLAATQRKGGVDGLLGDLSSAPDLERFVPPPGTTSRILSASPVLRQLSKDGKLPPSLSYCLSIGLKPEEVEATLKKFPPLLGYRFEGKMEKVVDFILSLDVPASLIPAIVLKRPQLFGCNVEDNLRPTVQFLEELGVERTRWSRILVSFPHILTYSSAKSNLVFKFFLESGVSNEAAGKVLSRFPHAVGYSVEQKLKPMAAYFKSIGLDDFSRVIIRSPQILGLSLEHNIKPTVEFFKSTLGFSNGQIVVMLHRFPQVLGLSVEHNLQPKWKFFSGMNRCKTQLVDFPQYFGYSLELRILPRHKIVVQKQISWTLNRMLSTSDEVFFRLTDTRY